MANFEVSENALLLFQWLFKFNIKIE